AELVDPVIVESNDSIIAVVGANMRSTPGISGKLFQSLGKNRINVVAVAQGSSELNISIVVRQQDEAAAVNAIHSTFFQETRKTLSIFLAGTGLVGSTLLKQINALKSDIDLRIYGRINSRVMSIGKSQNANADFKAFLQQMISSPFPNRVFVDCTSSEDVTASYSQILDAGIAVVTPNKKAGSGPIEQYAKIKASRSPFLYEATVGAGLPVVQTLQDLIRTGDRVHKIEAVLSGTLNYILSSM